MANKEQKTVDLPTQLAAERELYLGKTDKIPNSNLTVKEAREAHGKTVSDFEKSRIERAERVRAEVSDAQTAFRAENGISDTYTSIVVPGVNAEIKTEVPVPSEIAFAQMPPAGNSLPSDDELKAMNSAELITFATRRGIVVKANVDTEAAIIARIKGEYSEARFEPLAGKTRGELEAFATEFNIDGTNKDLFPNMETLTSAIEKARKK